MTNLETYFKNSQPLNEYIDGMKTNQDTVLSIYQSFELPEDDSRIKKIKEMNYSKVLVITEDWCGDAMMNLPILKHISEALNLEVRMFHRDDDTKLIDQYLTNGKSRAIPIFVFLNDQFEQETVWGPRANEVQKFVTDVRADKLPSKDHPDYADLEKETHLVISNRYKTDASFWKAVYNSILNKLENK
ncbi:TPA: thioredoxin family protein [Staphylococcus aureus]|nr:thioredoxin family protein [Staphylococcus aureus]HDC3808802.1 thioredoxin family protein [Staphylococcus aureus]HDC3810877.1 thioredoxin family protein [Staphylococcus aureus]HDC3814119.1 thioredoxin family protein [Staphylococcus aureus]